ncbi:MULTISPECIES: RNA polymerase sigma factor [Agrobacterium]|uniref:RNA polymerase sigma factor n=1 Tax=Agrobacterium tumefaciens TaxID=358 RepID=A0AAE6BHN6_AGRTU|nr:MULTISPECIES: RNA polymerase sigma factor [Agrobacterium]QCL76589.1 RNA polymerase sigma factor [Agrobacterium tumefaciens]QCL82108.1 RNA polymerase sigma factor [Agrobacterium tumefaciens]WCK05389.1 RNA polymerase sigma factor [Agrobacterium tumefaciens]CUX66022.1 RNA polymerase sigma factor [Agrobacterium sp. NCPPB 925]
MVSDPDAKLVADVAAGDIRAMRALVEAKLPRIMALASRMLGDPVEAEDVAQETFLRIWKHAGTWRQGAARFDTWIHRVALNLCYDRLRKRREVSVAQPSDLVDARMSSETAGVDMDEGEAVGRALSLLPERQREAIILVYYQEMSNREAADIMHVSVDALESLLSRGRRALQKILNEDET